jgi:hypothetical protein
LRIAGPQHVVSMRGRPRMLSFPPPPAVSAHPADAAETGRDRRFAPHANPLAPPLKTLSDDDSGNDLIYPYRSISTYLAKLHRIEMDAVFQFHLESAGYVY